MFIAEDQFNTALKAGRKLDKSQANAEFIGMALFSEKGTEILKSVYNESKAQFNGHAFHEAASFEQASFSDLLQEMIGRGINIACLDIYKGWVEVDTFEDYRNMWVEVEH
jgi:phosphoenolpyruvate phosphomutase